jgi:hypothetical protein
LNLFRHALYAAGTNMNASLSANFTLTDLTDEARVSGDHASYSAQDREAKHDASAQ